MADLGYFCLIGSLVLSLSACLIPFLERRDFITQGPWLSVLTRGQGMLIGAALLIFLWATLTHQWSWVTVRHNSHSHLSWVYALATLWSSAEGSFLVWLAILYGMLWVWMRFSGIPLAAQERLLIYVPWILGGMVMCALMAGHPFVEDGEASVEGWGLNPLLHHPYLVIHPPVLYTGYGATLPLFLMGFSQSPLVKDQIQRWALFSWTALTAGIALGSFWAYTQLGWGGWWYWDPVENVALVPWLLLTALIHTGQREKMPLSWLHFLSLAPWVCVQGGVWGVRAGLWSSVHSFAYHPAWQWSLGCVTLGVLGLVVQKMLQPSEGGWGHREGWRALLHPGVILLAALCVAAGTWYPVVHQKLSGQTVTLAPSFYHHTFIPLGLVMVLGAAWGPALRVPEMSKSVAWASVGVACLSVVLLKLWVGEVGWLALVAWGAAVMLLTLSCWLGVSSRRSLGGMILIHAGLALSLLGMVGDTLQQVSSAPLQVGQEVRHPKGTLLMQDLTYTQNPMSAIYEATFVLKDPSGAFQKTHKARLEYDVQRDVWTSHAAVFHQGFSDFLMIPERLLHSVHVRFAFHYHPLISWIWIGACLMVLGGLIQMGKLSKRRH